MGFKNNICQAVQKAIAAYVETQALSFAPNVYTSIEDDTVENPAVLVKCMRAQCQVTEEGNWKARARVELRENKDDTEADDHFTRAGELFSIFAHAGVAADLTSALVDFTCFHLVRVDQGWTVDGRLWVSFLEMDLDCCGSDIA